VFRGRVVGVAEGGEGGTGLAGAEGGGGGVETGWHGLGLWWRVVCEAGIVGVVNVPRRVPW